MIGKIHDANGHKIFASCDVSLLDKKILKDDLEITFSKSFYGTEIITKEEFIKNLEICNSANFFGKKVCSLLLEEKLITEDSIIYIDDVPHVQIYKF